MKHYELVYIVAGKYAENEVNEISSQVDALISKHGGTITFTQYWERKKLAYPIDHVTYGHYVITELDMKPSAVAGFERALLLSTDIVRHLIIAKETVGAPRVMEVKPVAEEVVAEEAPVVAEVKSEKQAPDVKKKKVAKTEEVSVEPATEEVEATTSEEAEPESAEEAPKSKKKTDNKVSFEDLDKKLDEILNNDII